jgi:hypothetical protein
VTLRRSDGWPFRIAQEKLGMMSIQAATRKRVSVENRESLSSNLQIPPLECLTVLEGDCA